MAGVHGLEQIKRLTATHLTHHDAVGPHPQAVLDQIRHTNLALAFKVGRAHFKRHNMRLLQLQLGGIFAGHHTFGFVDKPRNAVEKRCLA